MKKIQGFSFIVLGLVVGFATGVKYHAHYSDIVELNLRLSEQEFRADVALRALKHLRTDSTNTVAFLECNLDDAVSCLGNVVESIPASQRNGEHIRMIRKVKDYRAQFPYAPCPNHQRSVARAFSLLDEETRR